MERTALVLSGGGLRGGAHVGILKVFEQVGLLSSVQVVIGASAGSIVGAMLASGTSVAAIEQAALGLQTTPCDQLLDFNFNGVRRAICSQDFAKIDGALGGKAITALVENNLAHIRRFADYASLPPDLQAKVKDLLVVAVNLDSGRKTVFCDPARYTSCSDGVLCGYFSFSEAVRASSSEPGVVTPFPCSPREGCKCGRGADEPIAGPQTFVDGAVRDSCPVKLAIELAGCTRVLAVNLGYAGDQLQSVASQGMLEVITQSITIMGTQHLDADLAYLRTQVSEGDLNVSVHVLNPRLFDMGTLAFDRLPEAIKRGEDTARWFLDQLDSELHIYKPDGTVDPDRLFSQQGVFNHNYPDPEREERRQRLRATLEQKKTAPGPCHVAQEVTRLALLAIAAIVSLSLAFFTVGGVLAMKLKPNAASLGDVFVFWDGGLILFLLSWIIILLLVRWRACRST